MKIPRPSRPATENVLLVWDGTTKFIKSADRFVSLLDDVSVHAVHAMPHESIYSYGTVPKSVQRTTWPEQQLEDCYRSSIARASNLHSSRFRLLFGERINEIVLCAAELKAKFILLPKFEQSSFSKWIHGDLNERITDKAHCPVILLESNNSAAVTEPSQVASLWQKLGQFGP